MDFSLPTILDMDDPLPTDIVLLFRRRVLFLDIIRIVWLSIFFFL